MHLKDGGAQGLLASDIDRQTLIQVGLIHWHSHWLFTYLMFCVQAFCLANVPLYSMKLFCALALLILLLFNVFVYSKKIVSFPFLCCFLHPLYLYGISSTEKCTGLALCFLMLFQIIIFL